MDSSPSAKIDGDVLYGVNQPFLDKAIQRGDDVAMATKTTVENLYIAGTKQRTGFGREYEYLLQHGYTYDAKTSTMKLKK
ncbi:hypothetical protein Y549_00710 [Listeria monocytogenes]|nr:hypothetical protein [Listeria monocytogenes]EBH4175250.1 hypothetical protein [Listeria monocytogenes]EIA3594828.1 hypothetical protein [Listeria monocytogenes]EIS4450324.1 hypothetical protein [Listeria monocytogenes]